MYLVFDTETTGFPKSWKAPVTNLKNWPHMVQLAWLLFEEDGQQVAAANHIIYPEGFTIPYAVSRVHGITQSRAKKEGKALKSVLEEVMHTLDEVHTIVAHNIDFDLKVLGAELLRNNFPNVLPQKEHICTMQSSAAFCGIPGRYGYKWPKLDELHIAVFGKSFDNAHNAEVDTRVTADCFWALREKGVI